MGALADFVQECGQALDPQIDGDFEDPNDYLNVSGPDLRIEMETPGSC